MKYLHLLPAAAAAAGIVSCGTEPKQPDYVNFILINLDDAGNGDFSFSGALGYKTPNIDRLAREGMRDTNFYAAQPISGASRAGLCSRGAIPTASASPTRPIRAVPTASATRRRPSPKCSRNATTPRRSSANGTSATPRNPCPCSTDSTSGTDSPTRTTCGPTTPSGNSPTSMTSGGRPRPEDDGRHGGEDRPE